MALQMVTAISHASAVVDEPAHLTAGYLALTRGDLTVNREHPPLIKALAAAPLLLMSPALPPEPAGSAPRSSEDFEFDYSRLFLYRANDADRLLSVARLPVVGLCLITGLILFTWSRALWGYPAALLTLWLLAFEPNMLAHGRLVTTDMGATLFTLATFACLERSLAPEGLRGARSSGSVPARVPEPSGPHGPSAAVPASALEPGGRWPAPAPGAGGPWAAAAGLALGLAMLSRFSSLLLVPLMVITLLLDRRQPAGVRVWHFCVALVCALLLVNIGYGFAGGFFPLARDPIAGPLKSQPLASMEASAMLRWTPIPLPRLYVEGLDLARYKNRYLEGPGYLNGEYSRDGWWSYFVQALLMKSTLPLLALSALGATVLIARARAGDTTLIAYAIAPAAGLILLVTASTRAQIGLRYVLPVLPFLCLTGGAAASGRWWRRHRAACGTAMGALLLWHAWSAAWIHPYHLAYFNEAAGGPERGYLRLVDSNLDWGQDLVGLRRFMERRGLTRVNLYYFGTADPEYYGIERALPPEPGYFAVSATHLMGVYLPDRDYLAPFRAMTPETSIGHSILVYRMDQVPDFLKVPIRRP